MYRFRIAFVIVALIAVAACREEGGDASTATAADTAAIATAATETNPASPDSPGGTAVVPEVETGMPVAVTVEDNRIGMPAKVAPGPIVFTVKNAGTTLHNFAIEGENIAKELQPQLEAGQTGSMEVTLQPGTYRAYCPVLDHTTRGESVEFEVAR